MGVGQRGHALGEDMLISRIEFSKGLIRKGHKQMY